MISFCQDGTFFWQIVGNCAIFWWALWLLLTPYQLYLFYSKRHIKLFSARDPMATAITCGYLYLLSIHRLFDLLIRCEYLETSWLIQILIRWIMYYIIGPFTFYKLRVLNSIILCIAIILPITSSIIVACCVCACMCQNIQYIGDLFCFIDTGTMRLWLITDGKYY